MVRNITLSSQLTKLSNATGVKNGLEPLPTDSKGNSTVIVSPENKVQKIIGGKVSEGQEFDVFVARLVWTIKKAKEERSKRSGK